MATHPVEAVPRWTFEEAFARNRGLVSDEEAARLRQARVAIIGAGGGGGMHALTLARQGFGRFRIADPDTFAVANLNRQAGAFMSTMGKNKAEAVAAMIRDINPEADVEVWPYAVSRANVDQCVSDADVVIDGLDFFLPEVRRMLYVASRAAGRWVLGAGPMGYSAAFLAFSPTGMTFDEYFGTHDGMPYEDQLIAFLVGLAPRAIHAGYTDMRFVDVAKKIGPSAALACNLCASLVAVEAMAIVLGRRPPRAAPAYLQLDLHKHRLVKGRVWWGAKNPIQRLRRWGAKRYFQRLGVSASAMTHPS